MNTVVVTGPGQITGEKQNGGYTYYQWTFPVIVNGEAGVASVWALGGVSYDAILNYLIDQLEQGSIDLGGISLNDPATDSNQDDGRVADGPSDNRDDMRDDSRDDTRDDGRDDGRTDDDGQLASGDGGDDGTDSA